MKSSNKNLLSLRKAKPKNTTIRNRGSSIYLFLRLLILFRSYVLSRLSFFFFNFQVIHWYVLTPPFFLFLCLFLVLAVSYTKYGTIGFCSLLITVLCFFLIETRLLFLITYDIYHGFFFLIKNTIYIYIYVLSGCKVVTLCFPKLYAFVQESCSFNNLLFFFG